MSFINGIFLKLNSGKMKIKNLISALAITLLIVLNAAAQPKECIKTFKISGKGNDGSIKEVFFTAVKRSEDFTQTEMLIEKSVGMSKYKDFDFTMVGNPSQLSDCAGYVLDKIWKTGALRVGANNFAINIIRNFAIEVSNVAGWGHAREGDIVIYKRNGLVNHIAYVIKADTSKGAASSVIIETKNNSEGIYVHNLPDYMLRNEKELLKDPLVKECGFPRIYRLDPRLVSVTEINSSDCSEISSAGALSESWLGEWYKPGYTLILTEKDNSISITYQEDTSSDQYKKTKDPRIFYNLKFNGEILSGRWESSPVFEDNFLNKSGKGSGIFELRLKDADGSGANVLSGFTIWDSEYCNGCKDNWEWRREKQ